MNTIKLRWQVTKATEHDYWAQNNILRIYIRYDVQAGKMFWEACPINGGLRAKSGLCDTMPEAIAAAENAALEMLMEDLEVVPPAGIVLHWVEDERALEYEYNDHVRLLVRPAYHSDEPKNQWQGCVFMNGHDEPVYSEWLGTRADAQEWCADTIQSITTQSPRV